MTVRATLADLARAAGVSSATVDRVLNERPGVRPQTRKAVFSVAHRLGYIAGPIERPGVAPVRLAFLLPAGSNEFIASLAGHLERQADARPDVHATIEAIERFDVGRLAHRIDNLPPDVQGIGLVALDHPILRESIRRLVARGVQVVTLASDILGVPRAAYIGIDNRQAGRLAGFVMGRFLGSRPAKVAFFAGSRAYRGYEEREMGFRAVLTEDFPGVEIVDTREFMDYRDKARIETLSILDTHPDLAAIYNAGAGNSGIAQALVERGRTGSVVVIVHDATDLNKRLLLDGTVDALIDQNPRVEAREAIAALAGAVRGEPHMLIQPRLNSLFRENLPDE